MTSTQRQPPDPAPPAGSDLNDSDQLIQRLLSVVAAVGAATNVVLIALRWLTTRQWTLSVMLNGAFLAACLMVLWLARRGRRRAAAHVLLWGAGD